MARIFKDCLEMIQEMDRELKVSGISVPIKHYQNQKLEGQDQITKELIGVNFIISKPHLRKREMLDFIFKDESENIEKYCIQEMADRITTDIKGDGLNPGNSYKIRLDLWQKLMSKSGDKHTKFDYTYSERLNFCNQIQNAISTLEEDPHSRRCMIMLYCPWDSNDAIGYTTRVPCTVCYQLFIRNNKLMIVYYIRSNDYFKHFAIDIYLTQSLQEYILAQLRRTYPDLKVGSFNYYAGSLHAYNEDLSNWVIY